jgi:hypothetical protein
MATVGYGGTVERAWWLPERAHVIRHAAQASALFGYQWVRDGLVVAAFAGPEIESEGLNRRVLPSLDEPHLGVRLHDELWAHPMDNTLFTTTAIFGTARTAHFWDAFRAVTRFGTASSSDRRPPSTRPTPTANGGWGLT